MKLISGNIPHHGVLGFTAALSVHAAIFAAILGTRHQYGVIESETASISMSFLESPVIEDPAQGNRHDADALESIPEDLADSPLPDRKKENVKARETSVPQDIDQPTPATAGINEKPQQADPATERQIAPDTVREAVQQKDTAELPAVRPVPRKDVRKAVIAKGKSRGQTLASPSQSRGQRLASPGQVRSYAALVRARIARYRPRKGRVKGKVVINFAISSNGALRYARIARSSGDRMADRAAHEAVRKASPFPRPPSGMTPRQLSFSIPFAFR